MGFQEILNHIELAADIAPNIGKLSLSWQKQSAGFDVFTFLESTSGPVSIHDSADYLKLFMQVAERIYTVTGDKTSTFLCICTLGGESLMVKSFEDEEREQFKYSYIAMSNALRRLSAEGEPLQLSFFSEIGYEFGNTEKFEKEAQKIARILKGENKDDWMGIVENHHDFLKTDMYVFALQRLHSWGFQAITTDGGIDPKYSMVRPIRPKPRGAVRPKRGRRSG